MAFYFWDFGFDINASQSVLQAGFVNGTTSAISAPNKININDTLTFNVFDVTSGANGPTSSGYSVIGALLTFTNAVTGQSVQYPFDNSSSQAIISAGSAIIQVGPTALQATFLSSATSTFFGPGQTPTFPRWTIAGPFTFNSNGYFFFSAAVTVQGTVGGKTSIRTFVVDPEMIIGSAG